MVTQTQSTNLPQIKSIKVSGEVVTIELENNPTPVMLTFSGQETNGERWYEGMNSVRLTYRDSCEDSDDDSRVDPVAELFKRSPVLGMHAVLVETTLYIGTLFQQVELGEEGRYIGHRSIDLVKSADGVGFLPMKLAGDQLVPVQK